PPMPPTGLVIQGGIRECALSWKAGSEPDLKEYRIYRATSADGPYALIGKSRKPKWDDKGLADGKGYLYRITAIDTDGKESKYLAGTEAHTRGRPAIGKLPVKAAVAVGKSSFSWQENEPNVTGYVIYRSSSPDGTFDRVGDSRNPKFSEGGFGDGETHYYRIAKKYKNGLQSRLSDPVAISTKPRPSVPDKFSAKSGLARRVYLEWANPKESDIREFRLYRSLSIDGDFKKIASVKPGWLSSPSYTDKNLANNTDYFYKLRSIDKDNLASPLSPAIKATTKPLPSTPRGLSASSNKARSVPLRWEKNPERDIKKYLVFASKKEGGSFKRLAETSQSEFVHKGLKDLTRYFYKIKVVDVDALESDFSNVVSATTKARPAKPSGLSAESGLPKSARLSWNANPESDIAHYVVSRRTGRRGGFKDVGRSKSNGYSDDGLGDGARYYYKIRAIDADGLESDASEKVEAITKPRPAAPSGVAAEVKDGRIILTWKTNPESDITGYEIFRSTAWDILGGESKVGQVTAPSFEDRTAQSGKKYTYKVAAIDADGLHSKKSKSASAKLP
ncbi:MAG: hypothetical protein P8123_03935, partial [bacterium]